MRNPTMIVAIDGPSGAGKSTLGKMLADEFGLLYIDTGAMYRAIALAVTKNQIELNDETKIIETALNSDLSLTGTPRNLRIILNSTDVSAEIRTPEISQTASIISTISAVRQNLVERQREIGNRFGNCVLDGRDIGTVVFPNANIKFFITAQPEIRAVRRFDELKAAAKATTLEQTLREIIERDERDTNRKDSPLKVADDALVIDTTELPIDKVFAEMVKNVREKQVQNV
ncbi:MAG: (d)CMP kinase [Pyrinomonadaceae bacterium]|nr:(d)CMP kinase [Pyrinomonadaceae bacterium]